MRWRRRVPNMNGGKHFLQIGFNARILKESQVRRPDRPAFHKTRTLDLMRKTLIKAGLALAVAALLSSGASAQSFWGWGSSQTPGVDRRQAEQSQEINRGIRNGSLTGREAAELRQEQARIAEIERRAKADGIVTGRERAVIRNAQENAGRHIDQELHDRERAGQRDGHRGGWGGWGWNR